MPSSAVTSAVERFIIIIIIKLPDLHIELNKSKVREFRNLPHYMPLCLGKPHVALLRIENAPQGYALVIWN